MKITEIQVTLTLDNVRERDGVLAFVRIVLENSIAIRDIKVMERDGFLYLGMPSRKVTQPCHRCRKRVGINEAYCHGCGEKLMSASDDKKLYVDVVHPINQQTRVYLEEKVLESYNSMTEPNKRLKLRT